MADTRSVGTRGLLKIRPDDTQLKDELRRLIEHHRVTESTARYWARRYAASLYVLGLADLAFEDEFCLDIARQYHISQDHVVLFVQYVRTWLREKALAELAGPREKAPKVVTRVWKSLEQKMAEAAR